MANKQLSELTAATTLTPNDLLLVTQKGDSRKATIGNLIEIISGAEGGQEIAIDLGALGKAALRASAALVTLNGTTGTAPGLIPSRSIIFAVTTYVRSALTGTVESISTGIEGEVSKFGGSLGTHKGSNNIGVIGPTAVYSDTDIIVTANGGAGSANADKIRVVAYYLTFASPTD